MSILVYMSRRTAAAVLTPPALHHCVYIYVSKVKRSTGHMHTHTTAEQTTHTNTEQATAQRRLIVEVWSPTSTRAACVRPPTQPVRAQSHAAMARYWGARPPPPALLRYLYALCSHHPRSTTRIPGIPCQSNNQSESSKSHRSTREATSQHDHTGSKPRVEATQAWGAKGESRKRGCSTLAFTRYCFASTLLWESIIRYCPPPHL